MYKIGVVGLKDAWSTERLLDAVEERTGFRMLIDMENVRLDLPEKKAWSAGVDLGTLDAVIVKKIGAFYSTDLIDRLEMLRLLFENGLRIFSPPQSIMRVINRLSCTVTLQSADIPMPRTVITENVGLAMGAVHRFGCAVMKPLFSTKARGMLVVNKDDCSFKTIEAFKEKNSVMYIQEKVTIPGKDLGVAFLGGEYLTTYARVQNREEWSTSTAFGGRYEPFEPKGEIIDLARKAQSLFNLDFTCVDVVETENGPMVFEVSAFGGFKGIQKTSSIDAAGRYTDYVLKKLENR